VCVCMYAIRHKGIRGNACDRGSCWMRRQTLIKGGVCVMKSHEMVSTEGRAI